MEGQPVRIAGLAALRRALKESEAFDEIDEIGAVFGQAGEIIRAEASSRARSSGRPVDARLADTYKVTRSKVKTQIRVGDNKSPELIGQEWGAHHDRDRPVRSGNRVRMRGWNQFPEVVRGGRFLYPAAADKGELVLELIGSVVEDVLTRDRGDADT